MIKSGSSPLPSLSRKVKTTPPVGVVSSLKFRKKRDLELLLSWVQSSTASLKKIKTPSKKKIKDLGRKSKSGNKGGGFGLPMLPLLGIGALGLGTVAGLASKGNPIAKTISTATDFIIVTGDTSTNGHVYGWSDGGNGVIDNGELFGLATLTGVDNDNIGATNFTFGPI